MSTRTQRQSSLSSLSEAKQIVDGIPLGQVDPEQVVQVARRVYEGGGVQRRFQELCISGAPYTSFPSEGDGPQTVRQVTALLGHLDTIDISSLKPSACGCLIPAAPGSLINFCKGFCALDEDDGILKSPPFWSGHGGERKKGGGREGKERPLCHIGKGNGFGLGRGKGAASRWSGGPRQAAAADPLARACSGCR